MTDPQAVLVRLPRAAMVRRAVTEQAKGIIMAGRHCTAEEASAILQTASEQADRAPDDLAAALVARVVQQPRKIR